MNPWLHPFTENNHRVKENKPTHSQTHTPTENKIHTKRTKGRK